MSQLKSFGISSDVCVMEGSQGAAYRSQTEGEALRMNLLRRKVQKQKRHGVMVEEF